MRRLLLPAALVVTLVAAGACTDSPAPTVPGGTVDTTAMVLADPVEPATLNPLRGYAPDGAAKLFDGLMEYGPNRIPQPALAKQPPQPAADGRSWTVKIRDDVKFSDGAKLVAEDVVATYRTLLDPAYGSPLRPAYDMLSGVAEVDPATVRFDLAYPYPQFPAKLVLGILPHATLTTPEFDAKPIGTGPYQLVSWTKGDRMVLRANKNYPVAPKIAKLTVVFVPDDNTRAAKMRAGEFDGAEVTPQQAVGFAKVDGVRVITEDSADFRAVALPAHNPVTSDKAVRLALNYAMDRKDLIGSALAGKGTPASTPMPGTLPEFVEPQAQYRLDRDTAGHILDQAGWVVGTGGLRERSGTPAKFTVMYPTGDSELKAIAQTFASQVKAIGITVDAAEVAPADLAKRAGTDAQVISGGSPFDPANGFAPVLHTGNAQLDAAMDSAHRATDPAQRATSYRQAQRAYLADPGLVVLAFVNHTYAVHDNWTGLQPVVEPAAHGALTWGPWWNLQTWAPR